jgi:hypothetical protein
MERVAESLAQTAASAAENTRVVRKLSKRQVQVSALQLRAYVSVRLGAVVPQNNITGLRYEPRLLIVNTGHTPAYFRGPAQILVRFPDWVTTSGHCSSGSRHDLRCLSDGFDDLRSPAQSDTPQQTWISAVRARLIRNKWRNTGATLRRTATRSIRSRMSRHGKRVERGRKRQLPGYSGIIGERAERISRPPRWTALWCGALIGVLAVLRPSLTASARGSR